MIHDQVLFSCYKCAKLRIGPEAATLPSHDVNFCRFCGKDGLIAIVEEIKLSGLTAYQEAKKKRLRFYSRTDYRP